MGGGAGPRPGTRASAAGDWSCLPGDERPGPGPAPHSAAGRYSSSLTAACRVCSLGGGPCDPGPALQARCPDHSPEGDHDHGAQGAVGGSGLCLGGRGAPACPWGRGVQVEPRVRPFPGEMARAYHEMATREADWTRGRPASCQWRSWAHSAAVGLAWARPKS